ncbi:hypothetical protein CBR_g31642 [Chara braunii]|uniref:Uncharacterized protein n=1 Tax=Chara braunii TaxID=69332 RepID=A0A388LFK2_CHABU|nr:hypothetical protein CBR_g31642 [Chara braunii]|eukprot:GBG81084.1 hypothetical protein CBR_g31642 [Chara braunii]
MALVEGEGREVVQRTGGPVIGIDLGTSFCCVAVWRKDGVEIIPNENGNRITPSCVAFVDSERLVGDTAKNQAAMNLQNTVYEIKRLIGRKFNDPTVQKDVRLWPFKVIEGSGGQPRIQIKTEQEAEKLYSPEEISGMLLRKMKQIAEAYLDCQVRDAVITVPAYFNQAQRQATEDAGAIAGLNVLRIANEPSVAALAYGLHKDCLFVEQKKKVMVFDLGGGTCDVAIMEMGSKSCTVQALSGDTHLGGVDFDERLLDHVIERQKGRDTSILKNPSRLTCLRRACMLAKHELSSRHSAIVEVDANAGQFVSVSRAVFEELNRDLFERCINKAKEALEGAHVQAWDIFEVILVGGSTRVPKIQSMLKELFGGRDPKKSISADEAVAYGAAVMGGMLTQETTSQLKDLTVVEVTALSIGAGIGGCERDTEEMWRMENVIQRNTALPASGGTTLSTASDNQTSACIPIYEGERIMCKDNHFIGSFLLDGLQCLPRGQAEVRLTLNVDLNGLIHAQAMEIRTGRMSFATFRGEEARLTGDEIRKMEEEARIYQEYDEVTRRRWEARSRLEDKIYQVRRQLKMTAPSTNAGRLLEENVGRLMSWLESHKVLPTVEECEGETRVLRTLCAAAVGIRFPDP